MVWQRINLVNNPKSIDIVEEHMNDEPNRCLSTPSPLAAADASCWFFLTAAFNSRTFSSFVADFLFIDC